MLGSIHCFPMKKSLQKAVCSTQTIVDIAQRKIEEYYEQLGFTVCERILGTEIIDQMCLDIKLIVIFRSLYFQQDCTSSHKLSRTIRYLNEVQEDQ